MKTAARTRLALAATVATLLAGCAYPTYPPVMQTAYQFERHPGVSMETWRQTNYDGMGYAVTNVVTNLVNRGSVPKCAWTDALDSRLLRPGETFQVGQVHSPGNVVVTNVMPWDPNCLNAKREHGTQQPR